MFLVVLKYSLSYCFQVSQPEWLSCALSSSLDMSVVVLDTGLTEAINCTNQREADIVVQILTVLKQVSGLINF